MQHNVNISCNKKQENVHESPLMLSNTSINCTFQKNDLQNVKS